MLWFSMLGQHRPHKVSVGACPSLVCVRRACTVSELDSRALCSGTRFGDGTWRRAALTSITITG